MNKKPFRKVYYDLEYRFKDLCGSVHRWGEAHFTLVSGQELYRTQLGIDVHEIERNDDTGWIWEIYWRPAPGTSIAFARGRMPQVTPGHGKPLSNAVNAVPLGTVLVHSTGANTCALVLEGLPQQEVERRLPEGKDRLAYKLRSHDLWQVIHFDLVRWIDEELSKSSNRAQELSEDELNVQKRLPIFQRIKTENPTWTQEQVAQAYHREKGEMINPETVRNAYRKAGVTWKRGRRRGKR